MLIYKCKNCSHKLNNKEILKSNLLNINIKFHCDFCGAEYSESGLLKLIMSIYICLPVFMIEFLRYFGVYYGILIGAVWITFGIILRPYLIIITLKPYDNGK